MLSIYVEFKDEADRKRDFIGLVSSITNVLIYQFQFLLHFVVLSMELELIFSDHSHLFY